LLQLIRFVIYIQAFLLFIKPRRRSGLQLRQRPRLTTLVANGERVTCAGVIRDAPLLIDGDSFPADLYVMPLAGHDVILGTRWLDELGPIVWDLDRRRMSFQRQGRPVSWTGVDRPSVLTLGATTEAGPLLEALLLSFGGGLFVDPVGLPPKRAHDHNISLKHDTQPVAVRLYRYPAAHKDELERHCVAVMEQGIVRRSDSPFSSPGLLVKKPDGSWRFCVGYRALNALTVTDAFPSTLSNREAQATVHMGRSGRPPCSVSFHSARGRAGLRGGGRCHVRTHICQVQARSATYGRCRRSDRCS
jgi:hypothetical protein